MIYISYKVDFAEIQANESSLVYANSSQLHYEHFLGNVTWKIDAIDISAEWGWVPILDFVVCMMKIVNNLPDGASNQFEFTESSAALRFERRGNTVYIKPNYGLSAGQSISVDYQELRSAVKKLYENFFSDALSKVPELRKNSYIQSVLADTNLIARR